MHASCTYHEFLLSYFFFLLADNVYHRRGKANCFRLSSVGGSIALFRVGHDEFKIVISHV